MYHRFPFLNLNTTWQHMSYDNEALETKKREIEQLAEMSVGSFSKCSPDISKTVVSAFVRITPPTNEEPPPIQFITVFSSGMSGTTRKPGNVFLNWKKFFEIVPDVTVAGAGVAEAPHWLYVVIALYVWNKLWCGAKENLSDAEATAILALWKFRNDARKIGEAEGYERTNEVRREVGLVELSKADYSAAINRLTRMECIDMTGGLIWLREWVRIVYD
jgi:hypothetical protein